ncbi:MAG: ATP-binding protein [Cytophagales bacterium]|nr:ATP-binding protein [Cytophagales bacterium]
MSQAIKVLFTGPESTGKSTISRMMAEYYRTVWVKEYAREYVELLDRPYREDDLLKIAREQKRLEDEGIRSASRVLFCDTGLEVIKVWGDYKYGRTDPWILDKLRGSTYDLVFLNGIDMPWEYDPQREYPEPSQREFFLDYYKKELTEVYGGFCLLEGSLEERMRKVSEMLEPLLEMR